MASLWCYLEESVACVFLIIFHSFMKSGVSEHAPKDNWCCSAISLDWPVCVLRNSLTLIVAVQWWWDACWFQETLDDAQ